MLPVTMALMSRLRLLLHPRLRAAAEAAGDPARLDLRAIFSAQEAEAGWNSASPRIDSLGITPEAGMNPGDRRALYYLVRYLRPNGVLEIGTQAGSSAVHIAAALADLHQRPYGPRLLTVDIKDVNDGPTAAWHSFKLAQSPREAMAKLGVSDLVRFRMARSLDVLRQSGDPYDLIFLDGDHRYKTVLAEIPAALGRLRAGGFILLHDFFPGLQPLWPDGKVIDGPQRAVDELRAAGWPITVVPLGDLPWPTKQGTARTSLAILGKDNNGRR